MQYFAFSKKYFAVYFGAVFFGGVGLDFDVPGFIQA
jgi:hypothetical protein